VREVELSAGEKENRLTFTRTHKEAIMLLGTATRKDERQKQLVKYALKFLVANIDETTEEDLNADAATLERELLDLVSQEEN